MSTYDSDKPKELKTAIERSEQGKPTLLIARPQNWEEIERLTGAKIERIKDKPETTNPLVAQTWSKTLFQDREIEVKNPGEIHWEGTVAASLTGGEVIGKRKGALTIFAGEPRPGALSDLEHTKAAAEVETIEENWGNWEAQNIDFKADGVNDPRLMRKAANASQKIPENIYTRLMELGEEPNPAGALLIKNIPLGDIPPTPSKPSRAEKPDYISELALLAVARLLGQPVGYEPEHGGDLIQNISPTKSSATKQVSTSSKVVLELHTEAAFHPRKPRYLLLACLRGDEEAGTTLCSAQTLVEHLSANCKATLRKPWFTTGIDESYTGVKSTARSLPRAILTGEEDAPNIWLDADLMEGINEEAAKALEEVSQMAKQKASAIFLQTGDLLIVDNNTAVHGRTPFSPRYDGTDRWLQRLMIIPDLAEADGQRAGRIITTRFMKE